jgi:type VI secretion system protein ImpC
MLRWPYGAKTEPISPFSFEEFTAQFGLKGFLWGNSAVLAGLLLGKTFSQQGLAAMKLGSVAVQGDLPLYYYIDKDGDQIALPCTERLASEAVAAHIIHQGFMPVLWMRGRPEIRLGSFNSVNGATLAGPWAPVAVDGGAPVPAAPVAVEEVATAPAPATADDVAPAAISQSVADLDALLGELDLESDTSESDEGTAAVTADSDLDALLASIEGDAEPDEADDEGEMDPDLAALLAAL